MGQNRMQKENTIIGWGLAGAILAWQLYFKNKSFKVYDSTVNHASRVAAGMVNPIVFKRLTKSWNADTLLPYAQLFFIKVEQEMAVKLVSGKNIWRIFASVEEQNNWSSKMGDDRFSSYLKLIDDDQLPPKNAVQAPFGMGEVETFGNVDTNLFLDASKSFFIAKGFVFHDTHFDYNELDDSTPYFFCEGTGVRHNPLFSDLPFKPTHGETLIIETEDFDFLNTLNKNMYLMHIKGSKYKVGATYNWELTEPITTKEGKADLVERLSAFTSFDYKITSHLAGIRPTVKDRRPLLGVHEIHKNAVIFNGLGAKGVMIGPYYANQLLEHVFDGKEIEQEVNIKRFAK